MKLESFQPLIAPLPLLASKPTQSYLTHPHTHIAQFSLLARLQFTSGTGGLKCLPLWSVVVAPDESVSCHEPCWHFHQVCSASVAWAGGLVAHRNFTTLGMNRPDSKLQLFSTLQDKVGKHIPQNLKLKVGNDLDVSRHRFV